MQLIKAQEIKADKKLAAVFLVCLSYGLYTLLSYMILVADTTSM